MCAAVQSLEEKARSAGNGDILTQCMLSAQPEHTSKTEPHQLPDDMQLDEAGGSLYGIAAFLRTFPRHSLRETRCWTSCLRWPAEGHCEFLNNVEKVFSWVAGC